VAYKYTTGSVERGDIYNQNDAQGNTYIDWSEDAIGLVAGGELTLAVSGAVVNVSGSGTPLVVDGAISSSGIIFGTDLYLNTNNASTQTTIYVQGNSGTEFYSLGTGGFNLTSGGEIKLLAGADSALHLGTNAADSKVVVTSDGRVGIGTASPSEALSVIGDISGSGDLVVGDDVLIVSGSSVGIGFAPWSGKELHVTDGDSSTAGAPADSQVVVESGGNAGISLLSGGSRARIFFGDSSDIDEGIIEYKFTNSERFNIDVGGNEVMRIYESGASNTITTLNGVKTTAGLFTEGHPYYSNDENITVGDCCVLENGQIVRSSSPMQKNVSGIAWYSVLSDLQNSGSSGDEAWPLTLDDATVSRVASDALGIQCNMAEESGGEWVPTAKFQTLWKLAALGDSRQSNYGTTDLTGFKVCNEGGEVSAGDLLCTSTTPGFLMKQSDDIMRSYTVGKAMEDVTFDGNGQATGIYGYIYCG